MQKFTADFETATWLSDETYVWAWAVCEIGNPDNIIIDNNIVRIILILYCIFTILNLMVNL